VNRIQPQPWVDHPPDAIIHVVRPAADSCAEAVSNWSLTQLEIANFLLVGIEVTAHPPAL
jgi:hypothetical protein